MKKAFIIAATIIVAFAALSGCSSKNTSSESQTIPESNAEKTVETTVAVSTEAVSTEAVEKTSNVLPTESTTFPVDSFDDVIQPITAGTTYGKSEETRDWQAEWEEKLRKEGIEPPTMMATAYSQY